MNLTDPSGLFPPLLGRVIFGGLVGGLVDITVQFVTMPGEPIDFRRAAIAAAAGAFGVRTATAISRIGLTGRAAIGANIGAGGLINAVAGDITRCGDTSIGEFATDLAFGGFGGACCIVSG